MYPVRPMPLLPTFIGACAGSDRSLPGRPKAFSDPRARQAEDLRARLVHEKAVYELPFAGETLLLSSEVFPYFYALAGDRKPKEPIGGRSRAKASPLSEDIFRKLEANGPLTTVQLQEQLGGALSEAGLDRALQ